MAAHCATFGHASVVGAVIVLGASRVVVLRAGLDVVGGSGLASRFRFGGDLRVKAAPRVVQRSASNTAGRVDGTFGVWIWVRVEGVTGDALGLLGFSVKRRFGKVSIS